MRRLYIQLLHIVQAYLKNAETTEQTRLPMIMISFREYYHTDARREICLLVF